MANGDNLYKYTKTIRPLYRGPGDPVNLLTEEELAQRYGSQPAMSTKIQTEQNPELAAGTVKYKPYDWKYLPADVGTTATTALQGRLFPTEQEIAAGRGGWKGRSNLLATGAAMGIVGEVTGEIGGKLLGKGINKISSLYNAGRIARNPGYKLKSLIAQANKESNPNRLRELQDMIFNEYHQDTQNFITHQQKMEMKNNPISNEVINENTLSSKISKKKDRGEIEKRFLNKEIGDLFPSESGDKDLLLQFKKLEPQEYYYKNKQEFINAISKNRNPKFNTSEKMYLINYANRTSIPPYMLGFNPTLFDLGIFRYKNLRY